MLQAQSVRELNLWQTRHEFAEKSSKIVPFGAPFFPYKMMIFWNTRTAEPLGFTQGLPFWRGAKHKTRISKLRDPCAIPLLLLGNHRPLCLHRANFRVTSPS